MKIRSGHGNAGLSVVLLACLATAGCGHTHGRAPEGTPGGIDTGSIAPCIDMSGTPCDDVSSVDARARGHGGEDCSGLDGGLPTCTDVAPPGGFDPVIKWT